MRSPANPMWDGDSGIFILITIALLQVCHGQSSTSSPTDATTDSPTAAPTSTTCTLESLNIHTNAGVSAGDTGVSPLTQLTQIVSAGTTQQMSCGTGFNHIGQRRPFKCLGSNLWGEGYLRCEPVSCGSPVPSTQPFAVQSGPCVSPTFGYTCNVVCETGYSPSTPVARTCQASGQWSSSITCVADTCALPTLPTGASMTGCTATERRTGMVCAAQCNAGHTGATSLYRCNPGVAIMQAVATGITCSAVTCSRASLRSVLRESGASTGNGLAVPPAGDYTFQETYAATCATGFYEMSTTVPFECVGPNQWSAGQTVCRRISCQSPIEDVPFGVADCNATFGSTCTVRCKPGYTGGPVARTCQSDGTWSGSLSCSLATCNPPALPTGATLIACSQAVQRQTGKHCSAQCGAGYTGDTVSYSCEPGDTTMTPMSQPIACVAQSCTLNSLRTAVASGLAATDNGYAVPTGAAVFAYGAQYTAACGTGFVQVGTPTPFECIGTNTWGHGETVCRLRSCQSPTQGIANAVANCNTTYGSSCVVSCATGYTGGTQNSVTRTCQASGVWSRTLTCTPIQCNLPTLSNAAFATACGSRIATLATCTAQCNEGFTGNATTYQCGTDGVTRPTSSAIACIAITCTRASLQAAVQADIAAEDGNGIAVVGGPATYTYGDTYTASCATGFTRVGPQSNWRCVLPDRWEAGTISCVRDTCDAIPLLNARLDDTACGVRYGSSCTARCVSGYLTASQTYACGSDSQWSPALPANRLECGCPAFNVAGMWASTRPTGLIDAFATGGCTAMAEGSTCTTVQCPTDFVRAGTGSLTCGANGVWLGSVRCVPQLRFKTGEGLYFESPALPGEVTYTMADPLSPTWGQERANAFRSTTVPAAPDEVVATVEGAGGGVYELLRIVPDVSGYTTVQVSSTDTVQQDVDDRILFIRQNSNLRSELAPFVGSGGSGEYVFSGHKNDDVLGTLTWSAAVASQYALSGLLLTDPSIVNYVYVTVTDRFYGSAASVRIVFQSIQSLVPSITSLNGIPRYGTEFAFFNVTEGGFFAASVNPEGVPESVKLTRRCRVLDQFLGTAVEELVACGTLSYTIPPSAGNGTITVLQTLPANATEYNWTAPCVFPFTYNGASYTGCIPDDNRVPWCSTVLAATNGTMYTQRRNCSAIDRCSRDGIAYTYDAFSVNPVNPPADWAYGLPTGLDLATNCTISGSPRNNNVDDASSGFLQKRLVIRVTVTADVNGTSEDINSDFPMAFNLFPEVRVVIDSPTFGARNVSLAQDERGMYTGVNVSNETLGVLSDMTVLDTELISVNEEYRAQIIITGGQEPYFIPPATIELPSGLFIERVYQIRGIPITETLDEGTNNVGPANFSFSVVDAYPEPENIDVGLQYTVGIEDCTVSSNGPNGRDCGTDGDCVDGTRFDRAFTCTCRINSGDNCDIVPTQAPEAAAVESAGGGSGTAVTVGITVVFLLILVLVLAYMTYQRRLLNQPFDFEAEIAKMVEGGMLAQLDGERKMPKELKRTNITMLEKLGSGAFGDVNKGLYNPEMPGVPEFAVAIKVLKENPTREERDELMKEATVSAQFDHDNVVMCIGVVTSGNPAMLVLQLCDKGSLITVLKPEDEDKRVSPDMKGKFCLHVAYGMNYLASLGFVHRDLAARNVLVDAKDTAKIADFGLSRDTEDNDYYVAKAGKVPIRWTAPEALTARKFSEQSDVWAYGITCIEIWTDAITPYKGWMNAFVMEQVLDGYVHPRPPVCPEGLYDILIAPSLAFSPKQRPNFATLTAAMAKYYESDEWLAVAGSDSLAASCAKSIAESLQNECANGKTPDRYKDVSKYVPIVCSEFKPQPLRKAYCANCFAKNCQNYPDLDEGEAGSAGLYASLTAQADEMEYNHGRIDEDEAEIRLRELVEGMAVELTFPERRTYLVREIDPRTIVMSLLCNGSYGHHVLEFCDDMSWRERGKDDVTFGTSLTDAVGALLDSLALQDLIPIPCAPEMKSINSQSTSRSEITRGPYSHAKIGTEKDQGDLPSVTTKGLGRSGSTKAEQAADAAAKQRWWAGDLPKSAVRAAVSEAGSGAYLIRKSSREGTVVFVCNDNGVCVDYPIAWNYDSQDWSFVGMTFKTLAELVLFMLDNPLTSKSGGYDVIFTNPAPGGVEVNLEHEMFEVPLPAAPAEPELPPEVIGESYDVVEGDGDAVPLPAEPDSDEEGAAYANMNHRSSSVSVPSRDDFGGFNDAETTDASETAQPSLFPRLNLANDAGGTTKTDEQSAGSSSSLRPTDVVDFRNKTTFALSGRESVRSSASPIASDDVTELGEAPDPDAMYVNDPIANLGVLAPEDAPPDGNTDSNHTDSAPAGAADDTPSTTDVADDDRAAADIVPATKAKTKGLGRLLGKFGRKKEPSRVHEGASPLVPVHKKNEVFGEGYDEIVVVPLFDGFGDDDASADGPKDGNSLHESYLSVDGAEGERTQSEFDGFGVDDNVAGGDAEGHVEEDYALPTEDDNVTPAPANNPTPGEAAGRPAPPLPKARVTPPPTDQELPPEDPEAQYEEVEDEPALPPENLDQAYEDVDEMPATASAGGPVSSTTRFWHPDVHKTIAAQMVTRESVGTYLIRASSKAQTLVLVVNDNGMAANYPITWNAGAAQWEFLTIVAPTLHELLCEIYEQDFKTKKAGGSDYSLTAPVATDGVPFDFEAWRRTQT
eukprot:m.1625628 g.1625628  ORF g.1625628 m.1625628 type:complete len:2691 (-) comp25395_c0_seq1:2497-10569(-)